MRPPRARSSRKGGFGGSSRRGSSRKGSFRTSRRDSMFGLRTRSLFFDRSKVILAMDAATRRVLSFQGAVIRRSARRSIIKRKRASKPGKPPSSHRGFLRKFIFFSYDPTTHSVVVGPEPFKLPSKVLPALEYGGKSTMKLVRRKKKRKVPIKVRARPFMRPALKREKAVLDAAWKNSVRR